VNTIARIVGTEVSDRATEPVGIAEAAARLGTTRATIRNRIARGSLPGVKRRGRWYVVLSTPGSAEAGAVRSRALPPPADRGRWAELIELLKAENRFLRAELAQRSAEFQRRDELIRHLTRPGHSARSGAGDADPPSPTEAPPASLERSILDLLALQADALSELQRDLRILQEGLTHLASERSVAPAGVVEDGPNTPVNHSTPSASVLTYSVEALIAQGRALPVDPPRSPGWIDPIRPAPWWCFWRR
jgi:hypothetical protein